MPRTYKHLELGDREVIEKLYLDNQSPREIAKIIGVTHTTIYRELIRGDTGSMDKNGHCGYSATIAQAFVNERRRARRAESYGKHP